MSRPQIGLVVSWVVGFLLAAGSTVALAAEPKTLAIGAAAPDFSLTRWPEQTPTRCPCMSS